MELLTYDEQFDLVAQFVIDSGAITEHDLDNFIAELAFNNILGKDMFGYTIEDMSFSEIGEELEDTFECIWITEDYDIIYSDQKAGEKL